MAIDFPASPTNGQTFTSGSVTYTYDGTKWTALASGGSSQWTTSGSNIYYNTGSVGIGTTPAFGAIDHGLHIKGSGAQEGIRLETTDGSSGILEIYSENGGNTLDTRGSGYIRFCNTTTEWGRWDSSGRFLVGTSSTRTVSFWDTPHFLFEGTDYQKSGFCVYNNQNEIYGAFLSLGHSRGTSVGSNTVLQSGDYVGTIVFHGSDGSNEIRAAEISAFVDGTPGTNDMPGRLVFSTTADGASSPTERMRINAAGALKQSVSGSYRSSSGSYSELRNTDGSTSVLYVDMQSNSADNVVLMSNCLRAANSAYSLLQTRSGDLADVEHSLRGDGQAYADGSWNGGGADYAEYFEWSDGNPNADDRRGIAVVLDGDKIRPAVAGEDPIGVISGNPSVVGDAAWNKWSGKYLRDEYGTYIQEDYEVTDDDGNTVTQQRRKLNPAYDPDQEYAPRENRPEWDCVGLMGKLRIRKGQPTGSRWIKMRDVSDSVEEWLVR